MAMKNPFTRIVAAIRSRKNDTDRGLRRMFGATDPGVFVDYDTAYQVSAVWACIDAIAAPLASSDWNVYEGLRDEANKKALPNDSLQYILNTRWNVEMTAQSAKRMMGISAVGCGNGYAEIERDLAGRIVALWPIPPDRVEPRRDLQTGDLFYRVTLGDQGGHVDLPPEDVLHFRGPGLSGFMGDDVLHRAIKTIAQAVAMDRFTAAYFGNSAQLGTVFFYKNAKLDDAHYERLKGQINQRHKGANRAFSTAILDGGEWDVKQIGSDADKAQLIAARNLSISDICRYFRVPPHKIAHLDKATNNNIEHQGLEFTRDTLRPWAKEIEQESDYKTVPWRVRKFVEIDLDWAAQGDYKSRLEAYSIARAMGVFSANDILRKLGENTIGKDGDIRIVQGANVKLGDVGAAYAAPAPAAPKPEPDEEDGDDESDDTVLTAWLTSVYGRIQRRYDNRAADLQRAGRADWEKSARFSTKVYALEQIDEMEGALPPTMVAQAKHWAEEVVNGCDPKIAAAAVMEKK